jgi:phenylacetate-CoA ligase
MSAMDRSREISQNVYNFLSESQYWPQAHLLEYQQGQLEQLLRHARANAPYYAKRLDLLFRGDGSIDWAKWLDVPILTRAAVAQHGTAMLVKEVPKGHGATKDGSSSGTTGHPVTVRHTGLAGAIWRAAYWRSHRWHGLDWSQGSAQWVDPREGADMPDSEHSTGPWGPPDDPSSADGRTYRISRLEPTAKRLEHLVRHNVRYLATPANVAFAAAMHDGSVTPVLDAILSSTTAVEPEHRIVCKARFGARIHSVYSSIEVGQVAHSCGTGEGYHVAAEFAMIEVIDDRGQPCPIGAPGRIVVTPFLNSAQPLIRYEQGDVGVLGPPCACGRTLPVLAEIRGRTINMFRYADGRRDVPKVPDSLRLELGAFTWQFVQTSMTEVVVRYVPGRPPSVAAERAVGSKVQFYLNGDFRITFERIAEVPLTASGKYLKYVCAVG